MTSTAAHPQCGYSELPGLSHTAGNKVRNLTEPAGASCEGLRQRRGRHFWSLGGLQQVSALDALGMRS